MSEASKPTAPRRVPAQVPPIRSAPATSARERSAAEWFAADRTAPAQSAARNANRLRGWGVAVGAGLALWAVLASGAWILITAIL